jgi:hypothetical protein
MPYSASADVLLEGFGFISNPDAVIRVVDAIGQVIEGISVRITDIRPSEVIFIFYKMPMLQKLEYCNLLNFFVQVLATITTSNPTVAPGVFVEFAVDGQYWMRCPKIFTLTRIIPRKWTVYLLIMELWFEF